MQALAFPRRPPPSSCRLPSQRLGVLGHRDLEAQEAHERLLHVHGLAAAPQDKVREVVHGHRRHLGRPLDVVGLEVRGHGARARRREGDAEVDERPRRPGRDSHGGPRRPTASGSRPRGRDVRDVRDRHGGPHVALAEAGDEVEDLDGGLVRVDHNEGALGRALARDGRLQQERVPQAEVQLPPHAGPDHDVDGAFGQGRHELVGLGGHAAAQLDRPERLRGRRAVHANRQEREVGVPVQVLEERRLRAEGVPERLRELGASHERADQVRPRPRRHHAVHKDARHKPRRDLGGRQRPTGEDGLVLLVADDVLPDVLVEPVDDVVVPGDDVELGEGVFQRERRDGRRAAGRGEAHGHDLNRVRVGGLVDKQAAKRHEDAVVQVDVVHLGPVRDDVPELELNGAGAAGDPLRRVERRLVPERVEDDVVGVVAERNVLRRGRQPKPEHVAAGRAAAHDVRGPRLELDGELVRGVRRGQAPLVHNEVPGGGVEDEVDTHDGVLLRPARRQGVHGHVPDELKGRRGAVRRDLHGGQALVPGLRLELLRRQRAVVGHEDEPRELGPPVAVGGVRLLDHNRDPRQLVIPGGRQRRERHEERGRDVELAADAVRRRDARELRDVQRRQVRL